MKLNDLNCISFQKKLMAKCSIKNNERRKYCNIYELEPEKDKDYFVTLMNNPSWKRSAFLKPANGQLANYKYTKKTAYVIEDLKDNCLGYCTIDASKEKINELSLIEVMPENIANNKNRENKYIVETLITFALRMAKKQGKEILQVPYAIDNAMDFYLKCRFHKTPYPSLLEISTSEARKLDHQNKKHTGTNICIVG